MLTVSVQALQVGLSTAVVLEVGHDHIGVAAAQVLGDFVEVLAVPADLQKLYVDREKWAHMSLKNIANSGIFSADRSVLDYAHDIWYASPVPMSK